MTEITPEELDHLERLCAAATPGEWMPGHMTDPEHRCKCRTILSEHHMGSIATISECDNSPICDGGNDSPPEPDAIANALLIAAARTALPDLIAEVRRLTTEAREVDEIAGMIPEVKNELVAFKAKYSALETEVERLTEQAAHLTADLYARDVEVEQLREALKPFAEAAKYLDRITDCKASDQALIQGWTLDLLVIDLRRARAALAPIPPGQEGEGK